MSPPNPPTCARCGAAAPGRFCTECGAPTGRSICGACGAELSAAARYCHRCGAETKPGVPPGRERVAWTVASVAVLLTVAVVGYEIGKGRVPAPTVAEMGNAGNQGTAPVSPGKPPDLSRMSPRERFDRLWERVMRAAEAQSADTVTMFSPMALAAYRQLDSVATDARLHAAMIHVAVGELREAKALADTIERNEPGHLFIDLIRGSVAEQENDAKTLARAYLDFLAHYDRELAANRKEYIDHKPILDDFKNRALASKKP